MKKIRFINTQKQVGLLMGILLVFGSLQLCADDLLAIYKKALQQDPVLGAALLEKEATAEHDTQSRARLLPQVALQGKVAANSRDTDFMGSHPFFSQLAYDGEYAGAALSLNLRQPLYDPAVHTGKSLTALEEVMVDLQVEAVRQNLIIRTAEAYFGLLAARDNLETVLQEKAALQEQLTQTTNRFNAGVATEVSQQEVQAHFDRILAQEVMDRNEIQMAGEAVFQLIGATVETAPGLDKDFRAIAPVPDQLESWTDRAEEGNLAVSLSKVAAGNAELGVKLANHALGPKVYFTADAGFYRDRNIGNVSSETMLGTAGVVVSVPLFEGGMLRSKIREAEKRHEKAEMNVETNIRQARFQAARAFYQLKSSLAGITALEQTVKSSELALTATRKSVAAGVRTTADELEATHLYYESIRSLTASRYQYLLAGLYLQAATGTLSEADLVQLNGMLEE